MNVVASLGFLGGFLLLAEHYWSRLFENETTKSPLPFWTWVGRGVGIPVLFWIVLNSGISLRLPPLLPELALTSARGAKWLLAMLAQVTPGFSIIGSMWAAVTFGWLAALISMHADSRKEFFSVTLIWTIVCSPVVCLVLFFSGWVGLGLAAVTWLAPVVHSTLYLVPRRTASPMYSRAIAKLKFGKYSEAEWEVIRELEKCEDDFEGWMLLADLYATRFHDLAGATQAISDLCSQPSLPSVQVSIAMHRLADWHLKFGEDPVSARLILEELCRRYPGSHLAHMAQLRIKQLPATRDELREQLDPKPIRLPALGDDLDLDTDNTASGVSPEEAARLANRCVEKLTRDPNNVSAREEFARILAERLDRVELAIEQMELLLGMPEAPPGKPAEWLSLLAVWQLKYRRDTKAAKKILDRLVHEFPQSPQAFAAQRRLNLIDMEERIREARAKGVAPPTGERLTI